MVTAIIKVVKVRLLVILIECDNDMFIRKMCIQNRGIHSNLKLKIYIAKLMRLLILY